MLLAAHQSDKAATGSRMASVAPSFILSIMFILSKQETGSGRQDWTGST
jgi:hypothetical protein